MTAHQHGISAPGADAVRASDGFTLIEAVVALLVAAILLAVALPAYSHARAAARAGAVRADLAATIIDAVRHAAITETEVVLCPAGPAGDCTGQPDWDGGWMAWADLDGSRSRGPNEPVVVQVKAIDEQVHLRSTVGRTRLVFQPNGGNAGSNVTFTLCDARGTDYAITLVLANDGRLRPGKPTMAAAQACLYGG